MDRRALKTAGNMNGKDVYCENCGEPWENAHIVEDFTDKQLKEDVIFGNYSDDPYGDNETCIVGLKTCECCDENE